MFQPFDHSELGRLKNSFWTLLIHKESSNGQDTEQVQVTSSLISLFSVYPHSKTDLQIRLSHTKSYLHEKGENGSNWYSSLCYKST